MAYKGSRQRRRLLIKAQRMVELGTSGWRPGRQARFRSNNPGKSSRSRKWRTMGAASTWRTSRRVAAGRAGRTNEGMATSRQGGRSLAGYHSREMTNQSVDKKDLGGRMGSLAARPNLFYSASPELTRKCPATTLSTMEGRSSAPCLSPVDHNARDSHVVCVLLQCNFTVLQKVIIQL